MSDNLVALRPSADRAAGLRPQPPAASSRSSIPSAADTPIIRAIDQLFANQGQRIAGLMGEPQ